MTTNATSYEVASQHTTPSVCHLYRLPPELRIIIYEQVFASIDVPTAVDAKMRRPSLLNCCRSVRLEAKATYLEYLKKTMNTTLEYFKDAREEWREQAREGDSTYVSPTSEIRVTWRTYQRVRRFWCQEMRAPAAAAGAEIEAQLDQCGRIDVFRV